MQEYEDKNTERERKLLVSIILAAALFLLIYYTPYIKALYYGWQDQQVRKESIWNQTLNLRAELCELIEETDFNYALELLNTYQARLINAHRQAVKKGKDPEVWLDYINELPLIEKKLKLRQALWQASYYRQRAWIKLTLILYEEAEAEYQTLVNKIEEARAQLSKRDRKGRAWYDRLKQSARYLKSYLELQNQCLLIGGQLDNAVYSARRNLRKETENNLNQFKHALTEARAGCNQAYGCEPELIEAYLKRFPEIERVLLVWADLKEKVTPRKILIEAFCAKGNLKAALAETQEYEKELRELYWSLPANEFDFDTLLEFAIKQTRETGNTIEQMLKLRGKSKNNRVI